MAWGTLRLATDEDYEKLDKAARRFADRHGLEYPTEKEDRKLGGWFQHIDGLIDMAVDMHKDPNDYEHEDVTYIAMLWKRVVRRALDEPSADGISWGYVGYFAD